MNNDRQIVPDQNDVVYCVSKRFGQLLSKPLPGINAQLAMAPPSRDILLRNRNNSQSARYASVLIPLFLMNEKWHTLLITRNQYQGVHSGQVAFAGGKCEPDDLSREHTALREADEEVGIVSNEVTVVGCLTELYIPPSDFFVTPVVGFLQKKPDLILDPKEVSNAVFVDLSRLFAPETKKNLLIETPIGELETPAYCYDGLVIWGATAMIISEFEFLWKQHPTALCLFP